MSWSFSAIGTADKIAEAIEAQSAQLSGQSKFEFDDAKPHLVALVRQNFDKRSPQSPQVLIKIEASGSGQHRSAGPNDIEQVERSCTVKIERLWNQLLV